jgi:FHA domain
MTDMAITACVPLPGEGLVARRGGLVVVTDGQADGPDPLLGALEEVTGDGAALILAAARATLSHPGQVSGACAGVTAGGEVAVLVHGNATVTVVADDDPEEQIDARGSMLPVSRTFSGAAVRVWLRSGGPVTSDDRLRLDGGVVYGGGVALTVASVAELAGGAAPRPAGTDIMMPATGSAGDAATGQSEDTQGDAETGPMTSEDRSAPTFVVPAPGPAALGRVPPLHRPQGTDFEYELFLGPDDAHDHDHDHDHDPADQALELGGPVGQDLYAADPAVVDGVLCARNHFNDPNVQYCRQCGIAMVQLTQRIQQGPRPPLGVLLLDDGTGFTLDKDYVVGREPVLDGDVAAGRARPLRIPDPGGTVSRLHLRISLIGWQIEVRDINSSNGSVVYFPDGHEQRLVNGDSTIIPPGTKVSVGHRSLEYQSYRAG